MSGSAREKIALGIFLLLFVVGGVVLIGYFGTGRSWSVAATMVDDSVGSMDDYTAIVFNGVRDHDDNGPDRAIVRAENTMQDAYGTPYSAAPSEDVVERIMSAYRRLDKSRDLEGGHVYASDVCDLYELKGADAITLNVSDEAHYADHAVLSTGGKRVGILFVSSYISRAQLHKAVTSLKADDVDVIVCIAPRLAMVSTTEGLDVVVLTDEDQETATEGDSQSGTLVVSSPERGSVGVVLISSNNVPSFKVVEEL